MAFNCCSSWLTDCGSAYDDLTRSLRPEAKTAFLHTRPGGAALFVPDDVAETYSPGTDHGGHDGDGRALRYLEWSHPCAPGATRTVTDYVFTLSEGDDVRVVHDRHIEGLFSRETWLRLCREAGFEVEIHQHALEELEDVEQIVFLCRRPPPQQA